MSNKIEQGEVDMYDVLTYEINNKCCNNCGYGATDLNRVMIHDKLKTFCDYCMHAYESEDTKSMAGMFNVLEKRLLKQLQKNPNDNHGERK